MALSHDPSRPQRRNSLSPPPYLKMMLGKNRQENIRVGTSEVRIMLLGKNRQENIRVGNFILRRLAFDPKAPLHTEKQHSEKAEGNVEGKHITLINAPHLFDTDLPQEELTERVKECMTLCSPGPHVILIVIQQEDFTEADSKQLNYIFRSLSEEASRYTMVLKTKLSSSVDPEEESASEFNDEWSSRYFNFGDESSSVLMEKMEKIIQENEGGHLKCEEFVMAPEPQQHQQTAAQEKSEKTARKKTGGILGDLMHRLTRGKQYDEGSQRLNLVLFGTDEALKASISDLLLGPSQRSPEPSSECVRRDGVVSKRSITLVEMPALYNTPHSEEEVMQEALRCVSLCDPGVHAFLLIMPVGPLTDENKGEMEKIRSIFSSKINDYLTVLFTTKHGVSGADTEFIEQNTDIKKLLAICKHRYILVETKSGKPSKSAGEKMLDVIEKWTEKQSYSLHMYVKAQEERVRRELKEELSKLKKEIQELKRKLQLEGEEEETQVSESLRIVLIGKTGNGKSATGNTILGREEFTSETSMDSVTKVCHKVVGEVEGKSVAVVDTPGLFDTTLSKEEIQQEIVKCISLSAPGPHTFIIVLSVGRITEEELNTLDLIKKIFGPKAAMFSIVLFTRGDDLGRQTIKQYIEKSKSEHINKLIRDCGNRYLVFNNREKEDRTQVSELLRKMEMVINSNANPYFTNSMFEEAEMSIKKKYEEILEEKEREIETEKEELKNQYSTEMEKIKKRLEEEKQKADEEKLQMERKFTEKMENLKKEFEEKDELEKKKRETEDKKRSEEEKIQKEEWQKRINELERENKKQKAEFEKHLNDRDEEDKRREEKYKQDKENLKNEQNQVMEDLRKRQNEELKRRGQEEERRKQEEENERCDWERKIKEAEHEKKEIQEDLKRKQSEWEEEKKREMKSLEEEDRLRKQGHEEELRAKQEEQDRMREDFEQKMEEERRQREEEKRQWREAERKESERKEREYEEKRRVMEEQYEQQEKMRKEEWERRKREDDERREEERQKHQKLREEIERERQEEIKRRERDDAARREREEKEREEMKKNYDQKIEEMKNKYEDEARKQAEQLNEFNVRKEKHIQDLIKEHQEQYEHLENLFKSSKDKTSEEVKKLQEKMEKLKKQSNCAIS